ncbi:MAG TPA: redoxin domain-containing protein, partial [Schlesneria sp.]
MLGPFSTMNASRVLIAIVAFAALMSDVLADPAPPFPTDPNSWLNAGPLSVSALKGKGIVLYYFEEDSQGIRKNWPELLDAAKKYDDQPVIFIAVNSGSPKQKLQGYLSQVKVPWPIMVDTNRDFEKASGIFQPISETITSQFRYITPDGEIHTAVKDDLDEIAELAAEGAAWKVEPSTIPDALKATWIAVEIGNYKGLAASLKKFSTSSKGDVKEAAGKLMEVIQKEIDDQLAKVKEAQEGENTFHAYELIEDVTTRFNGFELPKDVATQKKELAKDAKVKAGLAATKSLETARKQLAGSNANAKTKSKAALEKIVA